MMEEKDMVRFKDLSEEQKLQVIWQMLHNQLNNSMRTNEDAAQILDYVKGKLQNQYGLLVENINDSQKHMKKSPQTVMQVRELLMQGYNFSQIARNLGIDRRTVSRIANTKY